MRVMVTGDQGFIGSNIAANLLQADVTVIGCDDNSAGVAFRPVGVIGPDCAGIDALVHCAARADIRSNWMSQDLRQELWLNNVDETCAMLEALHTEGGRPVVFMSSLSVYGANWASEETPPEATSPYAASKIAAEALIQAYAHRWGLPYYILRLGAVVGKNYHHGHIADFARQAALGEIRPLDFGEAKRSYVHVDDVVSAVNMAVAGKLGAGIYNVVGGTWSCRDTVRTMGLTCEWPEKVGGWTGDLPFVGTSRKLEAQGWRATHSIRHGVIDALKSCGYEVKS